MSDAGHKRHDRTHAAQGEGLAVSALASNVFARGAQTRRTEGNCPDWTRCHSRCASAGGDTWKLTNGHQHNPVYIYITVCNGRAYPGFRMLQATGRAKVCPTAGFPAVVVLVVVVIRRYSADSITDRGNIPYIMSGCSGSEPIFIFQISDKLNGAVFTGGGVAKLYLTSET